MAIKKPLREYVENNLRTIDYVKAHLESAYGTLYRLGGDDRVYSIDGTNQSGAIFAIGNTLQAVAVAWSDAPDKIESIYWWHSFSFNESPAYQVDLPSEGSFADMMPTIKDMIKNHTLGQVEVHA